LNGGASTKISIWQHHYCRKNRPAVNWIFWSLLHCMFCTSTSIFLKKGGKEGEKKMRKNCRIGESSSRLTDIRYKKKPNNAPNWLPPWSVRMTDAALVYDR
jgi:hypothetical protein